MRKEAAFCQIKLWGLAKIAFTTNGTATGELHRNDTAVCVKI
jgi:hypothetical protein